MRLNLTLGSLAAGNIALTIAIQWYVVTRLGVGVETDALFAGMTVPQLVLAVVSGTLTHVLVPLLSTEKEEAFRQTSWGFFLAVAAVFALAALVLAPTAPFWVAWLFPGFSIQARLLTATLTRIQMIGMVFTAGLAVLWSVYNARHRFLWAEFTAIPAGVVAFAFLIPTLGRLGVRAAAWAMVIRSGLQLLLLAPGLGRWAKPAWPGVARWSHDFGMPRRSPGRRADSATSHRARWRHGGEHSCALVDHGCLVWLLRRWSGRTDSRFEFFCSGRHQDADTDRSRRFHSRRGAQDRGFPDRRSHRDRCGYHHLLYSQCARPLVLPREESSSEYRRLTRSEERRVGK